MSELENITILFHDTYEEVSKKYGYQTRKDTKVFDMESPNGKTMYETVEKIMAPYLQEIERYKNIIKLLKHFGENSLGIIYALKDNVEPTENEWLNLIEYEKYLRELKGSDCNE